MYWKASQLAVQLMEFQFCCTNPAWHFWKLTAWSLTMYETTTALVASPAQVMLPLVTEKFVICLVLSEQMQRFESVGTGALTVLPGQAFAELKTQIKGTMLIWKYPLPCMQPQTPLLFGMAKVGQEVLQSRGDCWTW